MYKKTLEPLMLVGMNNEHAGIHPRSERLAPIRSGILMYRLVQFSNFHSLNRANQSRIGFLWRAGTPFAAAAFRPLT
jgi:hypothetical protein